MFCVQQNVEDRFTLLRHDVQCFPFPRRLHGWMYTVLLVLDSMLSVFKQDGKSGRTVLFHAAETNQKAAVELLLNRGADPEIANYAGVVPAMAAQGRSHTTVARLLARALDEGMEEEKVMETVETQKVLDSSQRPVPLEVSLV